MHGAVSMRRRDLLAAGVGSFVAGSCRASSAARISLFDYLPASQQRRIVAGTSDLDCAPIIDRALREVIGAKGVLWLPRGTYLVEPAQRLVHADRGFECLAAIRMTSGMRIAGEPGAIVRLVPGFSRDVRPRAAVMFGTDTPITDIELASLTLDMNGRANPISPARAGNEFSRLPQAQIFVSSPNGVPAARIDRARMADVTFRDANGVSCIVMAQTSDPAAALGRGWKIERCAFEENGLDTDDHSSVFAYAEDVVFDGCRFTNVRPYDGAGVNTAIEVHGAGQRVRNCTFDNMLRGIWVANNYSTVTSGTQIIDNAFNTIFYGIDFFRERIGEREITDTRIERNRFNFDDRLVERIPGLDFKAAIQIASEFSQQRISIVDNVVAKQGHRTTSAFLVVTGGAGGTRRHDAITATGNSGDGLTFGTFVRTSPTAGLGTLVLTGNRWTNLAPSGLMAIAAGDAVEQTGKAQPITSLALGGGSASPATPKDPRFKRVFINATVRKLIVGSGIETGKGQSMIERGGTADIEKIEQRAT